MKYPVSFIALEYGKCEKHVKLSKCDQQWINTVKGRANTSVRQQNAAHRNARGGETLAKYDS